ncbi:hypothetical protein UFOVP820_36 [uncultured Caudovirales phage]|uniref:Uncharacterized protein n=1 Tax=uncultured Caudovirales phage TaxID=2100421 RepID=A0A6J5P7E0_9CAUD|nr:hypothetical protein UFOVP820_36 [uncultured Caudovirales phage]
MKAYFEFRENAETYGGLLGKWSVTIRDHEEVSVGGLLSDYSRCCEYAKKRGVKKKDWIYTEEARREAWACFRRRYG